MTKAKFTIEEFILTYNSWQSMKQRCSKKSSRPDKTFYVDRGITVCKRWKNSFENFILDMGPRTSKELTLDRFPDMSGNYEPSNCRWATKKQQAANTRNAVLLEHDGYIFPISEWARRTGLERSMLQYRIKSGWSIEDALTIEPGGYNPKHIPVLQGGAPKKLNKLQMEEIAKRGKYEAVSDLAKEFGVSDNCIYYTLKKFNINSFVKSKHLNKDVILKIREEFANGVSCKELAKKHNVCDSTIRYALNKKIKD